MEPRPYQKDALSSISGAVDDGLQRFLVSSPTGTGKTYIGLSAAKKIGGRVLWLANSDELVNQPIETLKYLDPDADIGIVKAELNQYDKQWVFASVQTAFRDERLRNLKDFDFVVADEAHFAPTMMFEKIIRNVGCFGKGGPKLLGITATAERGDQLRLDDVFQKIVYQYQTLQAIADGYLCEPRFFSEKLDVNLDNIPLIADGSFQEKQLSELYLQTEITDQLVDIIQKYSISKQDDDKNHLSIKKTLVFTVSVKQAEDVARILQEKGLPAAAISGKTNIERRRQILRDFKKGKIKIVINALVLIYGYDHPAMEVLIVARPTRSKSFYLQLIGRILRIYPGKEYATIVDCVGVSSRYTLVSAAILFGLEKPEPVERKKTKKDEQNDWLMSALKSQLKGVPAMRRSAMRWIKAGENKWTISLGKPGVLLLTGKDDEYNVEIINREGAQAREFLTTMPIDFELSLGIAEDYVRRVGAMKFASKDEYWRRLPMTDKQKTMLLKKKVDITGLNRGDASDLITAFMANDKRNDLATQKQINYIRYILKKDISYGVSKREAGRIIGMANKQRR